MEKLRYIVAKDRFTIFQVSKGVKYYYVDYNYPGFVWRNAIIFAIIHALYCYGFYLSMARVGWACWLFSKYLFVNSSFWSLVT